MRLEFFIVDSKLLEDAARSRAASPSRARKEMHLGAELVGKRRKRRPKVPAAWFTF